MGRKGWAENRTGLKKTGPKTKVGRKETYPFRLESLVQNYCNYLNLYIWKFCKPWWKFGHKCSPTVNSTVSGHQKFLVTFRKTHLFFPNDIVFWYLYYPMYKKFILLPIQVENFLILRINKVGDRCVESIVGVVRVVH